MDLDAVADELYSLTPAEFVAARNRSAEQARADGDRELAKQIRSLRRPTTAAWLVNLLVREQRAEMESLLDLGRELREVMGDLGAHGLRELTQQRYRLVSALVQQARALAAARDTRVSDEVTRSLRSTLEATLSDPVSAQAVGSGRVTDALAVSGFGATGAEAASPEPQSSGPTATVSDLNAKREDKARRRAEQEVAEAEKAAQRAQVEQDAAEEALHSARRQHDAANAVVDDLRVRLEQAEAELERQVKNEEAARERVDAAARTSRETDHELAAARGRLQRHAP